MESLPRNGDDEDDAAKDDEDGGDAGAMRRGDLGLLGVEGLLTVLCWCWLSADSSSTIRAWSFATSTSFLLRLLPLLLLAGLRLVPGVVVMVAPVAVSSVVSAIAPVVVG